MMADAAYEELYRAMRPGISESQCVGLVSKVLYDLGSEHVEGVNAISGERCSPHPHVFSDRILRPGDPAYFDILHAYMGYRTCYYRTFAVGSGSRAQVDAYRRCRQYLDAAIDLTRSPRSSTRRRRRSSRPVACGWSRSPACPPCDQRSRSRSPAAIALSTAPAARRSSPPSRP
jgi:hypothetical protein